MSRKSSRKLFDRRTFLKGAGVALAASAGTGLMPGFLRKALLPTESGPLRLRSAPDLFFAGTDGWISLPRTPAIATPRRVSTRTTWLTVTRTLPRPHDLHLRLPERHRDDRHPAGRRRTRRSTRRRCSG